MEVTTISPNVTGGFMLQTMLYLVNYNYTKSFVDTVYNFPTNSINAPDPNEVKCYGVYGCFPIAPPFTTESRPVNLHPFSPQRLDVRFPVFTKDIRNYPEYIDINDPETVYNLKLNPKGKIYVIAHGFLESGDRPWIRDVTNALIDLDKDKSATVIVVDWRFGSSPPYTQAVANIRLVGAITAHVIHMVYEELKLKNLDNVHMIGHSLGAHLSGYAGAILQEDFGLKLGRITGLDAAEPHFAQTDPVVRLDPTDADFVDVLHTDITPFVNGGFGIQQPIGHVDFYPNGGLNQPGCNRKVESFMETEHSFFRGFQRLVGCNHVRSVQLFLESLTSKCPFISVSCQSFEDFRNGECFKCDENQNFCIRFGLNATQDYKRLYRNNLMIHSNSVVTYFMTGSSPPFCKTHFKIFVQISNSDESIGHGGEIGMLWFKIKGKNGDETEKIPLSNDHIYFEPGNNYTFVTVGNNIGPIEKATVIYTYKSNLMNPLSWRLIKPRIYVDHILISSLEHESKKKLCPPHNHELRENEHTPFKEELC